MKLSALALAYLKDKPSHSWLHILLMALGMMLMTALFLLGHQFEQRIYRDAAGIDLVVGAKGSPMQLILSSVQHIDIPTGNIALEDARKIQKHPHIKQAIPISLGDSYRGYRIVGSEASYVRHFKAELAEGEMWQQTMQAVLGSQVAAQLGLSVGDRFSGSHGLVEGGHAHKEHPYHVVGILHRTDTVLDRLIVTSLESVWDLHRDVPHKKPHKNPAKKQSYGHAKHGHHSHDDHHHHHDSHAHSKQKQRARKQHQSHEQKAKEREVTALLVTYRNRSAVMSFPRYVNQKTAMQAASPAFEMARLTELVGFGSDSLLIFGGLLVAVSLISVFIALLNSVRERRYDLAVFRTLGASHNTLFRLVLIEGLIIAFIGSLLGMLAGHLIIEFIGVNTSKGQEMGLTGWLFLPSLCWLWGGVMGASALACLIPAWHASKAEIFALLRQSG